MTRFLYIADTHLGAATEGYRQQPRYPERLGEIIAAMRARLASPGDVDFVLHGGDMVDAATDGSIADAARMFDCDVPVYLCLGNHDLTRHDAVRIWMSRAGRCFVDARPDYTLATEDCVIHVVPNHWCPEPYFWEDAQHAHFSDEQLGRLQASLGERTDLPHLILTHSPAHAVPAEQTGLMRPYHAPNDSFTESLTDLTRRHSNVRCVLGAHNHMNMCVERGGVMYVTVSSLVETPFELKLFEIGAGGLNMTTVSLGAEAGLAGDYDESKAFTQGRPEDRSFSMRL
jgi:3',5'-cyclic AMP phosphodiesterase CpdA